MFYATFKIAKIDFTVTSTGKGIESIHINDSFVPSEAYKKVTKNSPELFGLYNQLEEYFSGIRKTFDVPLDITIGTKFQNKVWGQLRKIPFGKAISYKELAVKSGSPNGFRAVGSANGRNPIPIVIPCHRVINHNKSLGGFSCGLDVKRQLLTLEKIYWKQ